MIIARQLAHDPAIPLQKALVMVEKPPFILLKNLTANEVKYQGEQLNRLGVNFTITELQSSETVQAIPISLPGSDFQTKLPVSASTVSREEKPPADVNTRRSAPMVVDDIPARSGNKKHLILSGVILLLTLFLIVAGIITSRNQRQYVIKQKMLLSYKGPDSFNKESTENGKKTKQENSSREKTSSKAKHESLWWVDSAKNCGNDHLKAINFYKIAISFNKYNIHAWFGLLNAYRNAGMIKEQKQTREEMEKIFGSSVFSVTETVKPFGEIIDVYTTEDDAFRVEYRTSQSNEQNILSETYTLAKAFRETCNCKTVSIFATTAPGKGMIIHINRNASLSSLGTFKKEATISFLN